MCYRVVLDRISRSSMSFIVFTIIKNLIKERYICLEILPFSEQYSTFWLEPSHICPPLRHSYSCVYHNQIPQSRYRSGPSLSYPHPSSNYAPGQYTGNHPWWKPTKFKGILIFILMATKLKREKDNKTIEHVDIYFSYTFQINSQFNAMH